MGPANQIPMEILLNYDGRSPSYLNSGDSRVEPENDSGAFWEYMKIDGGICSLWCFSSFEVNDIE